MLPVFQAGETTSSNFLTFYQDVTACTAFAYEPCDEISCKSPSEDSFFIKILEYGESEKVFEVSRRIKFGDLEKIVLGEGRCFDLEKGTPLYFEVTNFSSNRPRIDARVLVNTNE